MKKYYFVVTNYSVNNGKSFGWWNHFVKSDSFLDIKHIADDVKKDIKKDYPKAKVIDVVVTNFIEISEEFYLYNTKKYEESNKQK